LALTAKRQAGRCRELAEQQLHARPRVEAQDDHRQREQEPEPDHSENRPDQQSPGSERDHERPQTIELFFHGRAPEQLRWLSERNPHMGEIGRMPGDRTGEGFDAEHQQSKPYCIKIRQQAKKAVRIEIPPHRADAFRTGIEILTRNTGAEQSAEYQETPRAEPGPKAKRSFSARPP
jgi:hypothetical protein